MARGNDATIARQSAGGPSVDSRAARSRKPRRKAVQEPKRQSAALRKSRGRVIGRVIVCVIVLALLCVPAVFVNTVIGYAPALLFVFLVVLCFAYCRICRNAFSFDEMASAESCVRGTSVDMVLRMRNSSFLYVPRVDVEFSVRDLFGEITSTDRASLALNPHALQDFSFTLSFGHIGEFEVGLSQLVIHDPLGLFWASVPVDSTCSILVTPRLREVDDVPLSDAAVKQVSEALRPSALPGSDYCGVRDYAQGDPLKLIHWKLSARAQNYQTKLFEEQSDPSLDVYLDLSTPDYDHEMLMNIYDAALETALSLEAYAHEMGLDTRLVFLDRNDEVQQFVLAAGRDFRDLMRALPFVAVGSSAAFERLLFRQATALQSADNIAVCSAHCTSSMAEALAGVRATQRNVLMFALLPSRPQGSDDDAFASLKVLQNAGIMGYAVDVGGDAS